MRIGIIYQKFVSTGGLEGYLFGLARALTTAGHELHVLTGQTDRKTESIGAQIQCVDLPNSKTRALLAFERAALRHGPALPVDVRLGFGRTTSQDLHRAGGGCHAAYIPLLNPLKRLAYKTRLELALERDLYTAGRTRHFVVNSALVRDQLIERYEVPEDKFTIIHTAVDSDIFKPDASNRSEFRQQSGIADDTPVLLFVSRSHRRKGLPALLAAWPEIHRKTGAQLWVAGPPIDRFIKKLPTDLHPSVRHFPESTPIVALYRGADLFVHPSLYDACANTVLQSMACGLPGIISTADGAQQFIEPGKNGWLLQNPTAPKELATLTIDALQSDRAPIATAARERMLPLTWQAHVRSWRKAIEGVSDQ